jgi:hypothetical protein
VNVIVHQAIPQNLGAVSRALFGENVKVGSAVVVDEENVLPIVPSLRQMMRKAGHDNSSGSRHELMMTDNA